MQAPDRLFHYASIETLALILKGRKMKFSALSKVNDLKEGLSSDLGDYRKYIFVSCWTENKKESIPLWHIYTPDMCGVRIDLPFPIFETYNFGGKRILFSEDQLISNNFMILPSRDFITKVEYSDDNDKITPNIHVTLQYYIGSELPKLGKYKVTDWDFEEEYRFIFSIMPLKDGEMYDFDEFHSIKPDPPFADYLLPISSNSFEQMEITLGPKTNASHFAIVESLVKDFNPKAKINKSKIEIQ